MLEEQDEDEVKVGWCWYGPLLGARQTVPRAETSALIALLQEAEGTVEVYTDHLSLVAAWQGNHNLLERQENGDLWNEVLHLVRTRHIDLQLKWVNSHPKRPEDINVALPTWAYVGNAVADVLADAAAELRPIPHHIVKGFQEKERDFEEILERMLSRGRRRTGSKKKKQGRR